MTIGMHIAQRIGLSLSNNLSGPLYPATSAHTLAATGITPSALYLFREASGNLVDTVGGFNLTVRNSPTFQYQCDDRIGVFYDAATDGHEADVNDLGAASGIYAAIFRLPSTAIGSLQQIVGRGNAAAADGCMIYANTAVSYIEMLVRDSGANTVSVTAATGDMRNPAWCHLVIGQIDRAGTTARLRVSRPGGLVWEATGSIAGFATLTGAAQTFGFGGTASTGLDGGAIVSWAMVATGAQCEGAGVPAAIARGLGFEA